MLGLVDASFFNGPHCHAGHSLVVLRCKGPVCKIQDLESEDMISISSSVNYFLWVIRKGCTSLFSCLPSHIFLSCLFPQEGLQR